MAKLLLLRCDGAHAHVNRAFDKSEDLRQVIDRVTATLQRQSHQTLPTEVAGEAEQEDEPQDDEGRRKLTILRSAIAKLHVQTGHSPPEYLARAIRLAGGTDQAVRVAARFQCSVCARLKNPGPPLPHNLRGGVKNFGDLVAMDTFTLADCRGNIKLFLNVIDVASRFGLTLELASHKPEVVWDTFMSGWTNWAGFPISLLVDGGGEFEGGFREAAELVPIEVRTTAGETPQQNGICERRGGVWKSVARAVIDQFSVSFLDPSRTAWMITTANWALNSRIGVGGFSPSQWVLGRGLRLPYDLMSNHKKLALQLRARDDPDFSDRLQMLAAANRAATAAHYHRGLAKAFLARSRIKESLPAQHKFECGDQVFYFRGASKSKREWASRWHGPALVLGFEGNNLWLSHRNCVVKCSVRHVRLAEPEEELPWKEVLDQAFRDVGETEEPAAPAENGEEEHEPILDPLPPAGTVDESSGMDGGAGFPTGMPGQVSTAAPDTAAGSRFGRYLDLSGEPSMKSRRLNPQPPSEPERPPVPPAPTGNPVADSDAESSSADRTVVPALVPATPSPSDDVPMPDAPLPVVRHTGGKRAADDSGIDLRMAVHRARYDTTLSRHASGSGTMSEERKRLLLDDLPVSIRRRLDPSPPVTVVPRRPLTDVDEDPAKRARTLDQPSRDVMLVGAARASEVDLKTLSEIEMQGVRKAMATEWESYQEFGATADLSMEELQRLMKRQPRPRIIDTRWVITRKGGGFKARLVVIGCQEKKGIMRTDSPTASHLMLTLVLSMSVQPGWLLIGLDARSAYLQSENIDRILLLRLPHQNPPPGCVPSQVVVGLGAIYGTRDAGRSFYLYAKSVLAHWGFQECKYEKAFYFLRKAGNIRAVLHTHVDDFLFACDGSAEILGIIEAIKRGLHMKEHPRDSFKYRGVYLTISSDRVEMSQARTSGCIAQMDARGPSERRLEGDEITEYRSIGGKLNWVSTQTRLDLAAATSFAQQRSSVCTVQDARNLNRTVRMAHENADFVIGFNRRKDTLARMHIVVYADSAFANAEGCKSQYGTIGGLANGPSCGDDEDYSSVLPLWWTSATVKRVVRSTLGAEGYAVSEGIEQAYFVRAVLLDIYGVTNQDQRKWFPITTFTDSNSLYTTVRRDTGTSSDKRLAIVVAALRETFGTEQEAPAELKWISTHKMVADGLTKLMPSVALSAFCAGKARAAARAVAAFALMAKPSAAMSIDTTSQDGVRDMLRWIVTMFCLVALVTVFGGMATTLWNVTRRIAGEIVRPMIRPENESHNDPTDERLEEARLPEVILVTVGTQSDDIIPSRYHGEPHLFTTPTGACFHLSQGCAACPPNATFLPYRACRVCVRPGTLVKSFHGSEASSLAPRVPASRPSCG